jgi:hypothetical protein
MPGVDDFETTLYLNGVSIAGTCSDFTLMDAHISGLGMPETRVTDLERADDHGSVAGQDFTQPRTLSFPVSMQRSSTRLAMEALRSLKAAWRPAGPFDDVLEITIPGIGPSDDTLRFYGRPRSTLDVDLHYLSSGVISALATYIALDPIGYGPVVTVTGAASASVNNEGDANSKRATIVITGNGGVPVLSNTTDGGGNIVFSQALGGGQTWEIDLYRRDVTDAAGDDAFASNVLASSLWFRLLPGVNNLTLTGAASMSVAYRSGWW